VNVLSTTRINAYSLVRLIPDLSALSLFPRLAHYQTVWTGIG